MELDVQKLKTLSQTMRNVLAEVEAVLEQLESAAPAPQPKKLSFDNQVATTKADILTRKKPRTKK